MTTWKHWLGRFLLLVFIAPSTLLLVFLATSALGVAWIADSGGHTTTGIQKLGGSLALVGLAALWTAVVTGAAASFHQRIRLALATLIVAAIAGVVMLVLGDPAAPSDPWGHLLLLTSPLLIVSAIQLFRLFRQGV